MGFVTRRERDCNAAKPLLSESEIKIEEERVEAVEIVKELATLITQVWKLFSRFVKSNFRHIDSCLVKQKVGYMQT